MPQFDRSASVVIGTPGQDGKRFAGLRIRFRVERDLNPTPNTANVDIYNLSEASRAGIHDHLSVFSLYAGYRDDAGEQLLFTHDVDTVSNKIEIPEIVTTVQTGDARKAFRQRQLSLSLAPGCRATDVCRVVAERMQIPIKEMPQSDATFPGGFAHHGPAEKALRRAAAVAGFEYSVQDGQLQFLEIGAPSGAEAVFVIGPQTGLIDAPERIVQKAKPVATTAHHRKSRKAAKIQSQWSFRCLLNAGLLPGRRVQMASRQIEGLYRLDAVRHQGDTHGDEWFSECEVSAV